MEDPDTNLPRGSNSQMELPLKEDIGAELDYFVFLTLLGLDDEASEFAIAVLWRHLGHFPVAAEIAGYMVSQNDFEGLSRLWNTLGSSCIQHWSSEEDLLLYHQMTDIVMTEVETARKWLIELRATLDDYDWKSQISVS